MNRPFLACGESLTFDDSLVSANGQFSAFLTGNGNLVVCRGAAGGAEHVWESGTTQHPGSMHPQAPLKDCHTVMQADGNLVTYGTAAGNNAPVVCWASNAHSSGGRFHAIVQDDGTLAVFTGNNPALPHVAIPPAVVQPHGPAGPLPVGAGHQPAPMPVVIPQLESQAMRWNSGKFCLHTDDVLFCGSALISPGRQFYLILHDNGELKLCRGVNSAASLRDVWSSGASGTHNSYYAILQGDGNLVVYEGTKPAEQGKALWADGQLSTGGKFSTQVSNQGVLSVFNETSHATLWATRNDTLETNQRLSTSDCLVSQNGKYFATMQVDGNFCVYRTADGYIGQHYLWGHQKTAPGGQFFAIMQGDGNFATYKGHQLVTQAYLWGSLSQIDKKKWPAPGEFFACMQDDGNFAVYRKETPQPHYVWGTGGIAEGFTDFRPDKHGLRFPNNFTVKVSIGVGPDLFDVSGLGFCGGMVALALNRFRKHQPVPRDTETPPPHTALHAELYKRQLASLDGIIDNILTWQIRPDVGHWWNPYTSVGHATRAQWEKLHSLLDQHQPTMLMLIRVEASQSVNPVNLNTYDPVNLRSIGDNHQVLAIGYIYNVTTLALTLFVYDPNHPSQVIELTMDFRSNNLHAHDSSGKRLRGFFVNPNSDKASA